MDKCGIDMYKIMSSRHTYNTPLCWQTCRIKIDVFTVICYLDTVYKPDGMVEIGVPDLVCWNQDVMLCRGVDMGQDE